MLSQLVQIASRFETKHGYRPNLLYLNRNHYTQLQRELASIQGLGQLSGFLGMELLLSEEYPHPNVAWSPIAWQHAIAV